ncbi:hypothetical protein MNBD_BACTEROID05-944 [hydrothermal vent metagenome]|uniref:DUF3179 domain-containing protein n=1 Tax=hydrothermal vent metagenome TaxID=652676 RepID=A0A3B0T2K5_9ZZZZ
MRVFITRVVISVVVFLGIAVTSSFAGVEDFNTQNAIVNLNAFYSGGPQKDGIPALTNPEFVSADQAGFLSDNNFVIGIEVDRVAKAYPLKILNWHEVVNDVISQKEVVVSWCPLTHSGLVFDRKVGEDVLTFGVSGMLFNSNVVMYDRNSQGLWTQLGNKSLTGKYASKKLNLIPSKVTMWKNWKKAYPNTLVLSSKTGYFRNYKRDPYQEYHLQEKPMFPLEYIDTRFPLKSFVLGVQVDGEVKAYSLTQLKEMKKPLKDSISGKSITIRFDENQMLQVIDKDGNEISSVVAYWFAWRAFYPKTLVYSK